ncbi:MAG: oligopeptide transporter, OPT family [Gammaproteobacteria bacterium]|nr:oligopeptide transporter, OPT family [Gammaproteobacteria bacterium]
MTIDKTQAYLPEITVKAVIFSIILTIFLAASNIYLGLKAGATISASIPSVVIALAFFRLFRKSNILEVNTIQTAASVGEGLISGLIFTIPALIIIHFWSGFNYWDIVIIGASGGILGIVISVPLQRALLNDKTLYFPEGTAIGQVMKAGMEGGSQAKPILWGGLVGAVVVFLQSGFGILAGDFKYWVLKGKTLFGFGIDFSPALIAAGYICGINLASGMVIGLVLAWGVGLPFLTTHFGIPHASNLAAIASNMWSSYIRYIGIGTMLTGGIWTLILILKPVVKAIKASLHALHDVGDHGDKVARDNIDIPINYLFWIGIIVLVIITVKLATILLLPNLGLPILARILTLVICIGYLLIASFIFCSVAGYFAGLVGASNNPVSGLIIAALLMLSLILLAITSSWLGQHQHVDHVLIGGIAIMICSFIGCATTMCAEACQVAKIGSIAGGTPWRQQVIMIISVITLAFVTPFIFNLLFNAYGIGGVFPRAGMPVAQMLPAPQAGLVAAITQAVFTHKLPWSMLIIGIVIGICGIICDEILRTRYNKRLLVLAVGLGIYLPMNIAMPIIVGGFLSYFVQNFHVKNGIHIEKVREHDTSSMRNALFLASGLVAGSTIMGVVLAIPFALSQNSNILNIMPQNLLFLAKIASIIIFITLCYWIYRTGSKGTTTKRIDS